MTKIQIPVSCRPQVIPSESQRRRVSKCLFGRPSPGETETFLRKKLGEIQAEAEQKWNFDFTTGVPTRVPPPHSSSGEKGGSVSPWIWSVMDASNVPSFYRVSKPSPLSSSRLNVEENFEEASRKMDHSSSSSIQSWALTVQESATPKKLPQSGPILPSSPSRKRGRVNQYYGSRKRSVDCTSLKFGSRMSPSFVPVVRQSSESQPAKIPRLSFKEPTSSSQE